MRYGWAMAMVGSALAGCHQPTPNAGNDNQLAPVAPEPALPVGQPEPPKATQNATNAPTSPPPARPDASLAEGPIDPKGAQGAGQVVQHYGALLEQHRFAEARKLWSDNGRASGLTEAEFAAAYAKYDQIHSEIGDPGTVEGAAGSLYVDIPFRLYGTFDGGKPFNLTGPLTLRRVNDVPGSSAEQRRWHISQSGLKPRP